MKLATEKSLRGINYKNTKKRLTKVSMACFVTNKFASYWMSISQRQRDGKREFQNTPMAQFTQYFFALCFRLSFDFILA